MSIHKVAKISSNDRHSAQKTSAQNVQIISYTLGIISLRMRTIPHICLTVTAWCIIGLLGVLFIRSLGFREFNQEKIITWLVGIAMIFFLIALMFN